MPILKRYIDREYEKSTKGYHRTVLGRDKDNKVEVVELKLEKNEKIRLHYHTTMTEMFYVVEGRVKIKVDNNIYELVSGDFLIVFPNEKHELANDDKESRILAIKYPAIEDTIFIE